MMQLRDSTLEDLQKALVCYIETSYIASCRREACQDRQSLGRFGYLLQYMKHGCDRLNQD